MRILSLLALSFSLSASAFGQIDIPKGEIPREIKVRLQEILQENADAPSYQEWIGGGNTPADLFASIQTAKQRAELCTALGALSQEDLTLFQNELEESASLPCREGLTYRLNRYWAPRKSGAVLLPMIRGVLRLENRNSAPLPSTEIHVDASQGPVLFSGDLKPGQIGITLDDGPHPTHTQEILDILAAYGVRATYFMVGANAQKMPALAKAAATQGHSVGSHSWSHRQLPKISLTAAKSEVDRGRQAVMEASGVDVPFFRFPYGARSTTLQNFVQAEGMASFFWNMDSLDWKHRNVDTLYQNIVRKLDQNQGGIILFHDIHPQTVAVFPRFLELLRERNYETVLFVPH